MFDPLSIIVYGMCQLFPIFLLSIFPRSNQRIRIWIYLLAYAPICVFAALRGTVGTDTEAYRSGYDGIDGLNGFGVDPLYSLFEWIFWKIGFGSQGFFAGQAIFCWSLFSFGAARVDRSIPVLGIGLLPVLLLDATFNGLRYGMAFALTLALISYLEHTQGLRRVILSILPGFFHSSMLVLLLVRVRTALFIGIIAGISALLYIERFNLILAYFSFKLSEYNVIQRPSWYSGINPLFQVAMLCYVAKKSKCSFKYGSNLVTLSAILILVAIGGLYISYASLRILQIGVFLLAISVSMSAAKTTTVAKVAIFIMGMIGVLNFWRQIFIAGPEGFVSFVPYRFF